LDWQTHRAPQTKNSSRTNKKTHEMLAHLAKNQFSMWLPNATFFWGKSNAGKAKKVSHLIHTSTHFLLYFFCSANYWHNKCGGASTMLFSTQTHAHTQWIYSDDSTREICQKTWKEHPRNQGELENFGTFGCPENWESNHVSIKLKCT